MFNKREAIFHKQPNKDLCLICLNFKGKAHKKIVIHFVTNRQENNVLPTTTQSIQFRERMRSPPWVKCSRVRRFRVYVPVIFNSLTPLSSCDIGRIISLVPKTTTVWLPKRASVCLSSVKSWRREEHIHPLTPSRCGESVNWEQVNWIIHSGENRFCAASTTT